MMLQLVSLIAFILASQQIHHAHSFSDSFTQSSTLSTQILISILKKKTISMVKAQASDLIIIAAPPTSKENTLIDETTV